MTEIFIIIKITAPIDINNLTGIENSSTFEIIEVVAPTSVVAPTPTIYDTSNQYTINMPLQSGDIIAEKMQSPVIKTFEIVKNTGYISPDISKPDISKSMPITIVFHFNPISNNILTNDLIQNIYLSDDGKNYMQFDKDFNALVDSYTITITSDSPTTSDSSITSTVFKKVDNKEISNTEILQLLNVALKTVSNLNGSNTSSEPLNDSAIRILNESHPSSESLIDSSISILNESPPSSEPLIGSSISILNGSPPSIESLIDSSIRILNGSTASSKPIDQLIGTSVDILQGNPIDGINPLIGTSVDILQGN